MDKIINEVLDPNNQKIFNMMKDVLLLFIVLYSVFLNSFMINRNMNKLKSNFIFTCIALVSVWQIYENNIFIHTISNLVWFVAILMMYSNSENISKKYRSTIYCLTFMLTPIFFLLIYLRLMDGEETVILDNVIFYLTIVACSCIHLITNDNYIKITTGLMAFFDIFLHLAPEFIKNIDLICVISILNLASYIFFMNSMQKFVDKFPQSATN